MDLLSRMAKENQISPPYSNIDLHRVPDIYPFEEQLRKKEEELDLVMSSLDDIVFQYNEEGQFIRQWCRNEKLLKSIPEGYVGRSLQEAFRLIPAFAGQFIEDFEQAINKKEIYYRDFKYTENNETHWFNSKISPLFYPNGDCKGFTQRITDISERKKVELAVEERNIELQSINKQYREIVEHATEAIFKVDASGHFFFISKEFVRLLGYTQERITGVHFGSIVHPDDLKVCLEIFSVLTQFGKADKNLTFRVKHIQGHYLWVDCSAVCLFTDDGQPTHVIGFARDITIQKNIERELRMSEERYRSLFDSLGEGITLIDNTGYIIASNKAAENIFSTSKERIMKYHAEHSKQSFLHEDGTPFPPETHPGPLTLKTGQSFKNVIMGIAFEYHEIKWISINTEAVYYSDNRDKPDAVVASFVDITERIIQEKILSLEKEVLEINAQPAASLTNIIDYFLGGLEKIFPGMSCTVLALSPDSKRMMHVSAPSVPAAFTEAINDVEIGPGVGSCGTAMYLKKRVITTDISDDISWESHKELALQHGLRACWSFPILNAKNDVLATIAAYHKEIKAPDDGELMVFERVSNLLRVIIENKRAEATVRLSNERYLLATKATNEALWDWDLPNNILFWGDGFYNLFGYQPGETDNSLGFWESCLHPDDHDRVMESLNKFIKKGSSGIWKVEYQFRNADGKYLLVFDRGFLIFDQEGKINRMVGSAQDITRKKELEKKLMKEELDRQKLVAQAVVDAQEKERAEIGKELHDNVNQILSTTRLYLELARNDDKDRILLINRSVNNISSAISEIRNISRSLVPSSIEDLGLVASIDDLVENIRFTRTINVEFYHQGEIEHVMIDNRKLMLFRIIQEQVTNILKHAEARNLIIELIVDDKYVNLSISDDGKGFDKEKIKGKKGVGLYNIESRAELVNGTVNMVTEPGKGCKLNVYIPISIP
ncbi:MAG: PAS domain S-box protein [Flavitalea sp.]